MKRTFFIIVASLITIITKAQYNKSIELFLQFEERFILLDSLIFSTPNTSTPPQATDVITYNPTSISSTQTKIDSLIEQKINAQKSALKHETGLNITGQAYFRLDDNLSIDEEDAVSRYDAKIQADLRWHFLNSAVLHRKGRLNEIDLQGEIDKKNYERTNISLLVAKQKELFRIKNDSLLSSILKHRIYNLTLLNNGQQYLLENGNITTDDILTTLNEKAEAERLLASLIDTVAPANSLYKPTGVIVDIDTAKLMEYIRQYNANLSILDLKSQLLEQQQQNNSYWTTLNVSPFIRYSYYFRDDMPNSTNVDLGLSFIIPLSGETSKQRKTMTTELKILEIEKSQLSQQILDNIKLILLDIERMNRASASELYRMQEIKKYIQTRTTAYHNGIGEYNFVSRMKEYNTYLLCWEKFLSFQYQRDCHIANLQTYLPNISILEFCIETEI